MVDPGETSPLLADTDADGVDDNLDALPLDRTNDTDGDAIKGRIKNPY